jgi:hypothetical protein
MTHEAKPLTTHPTTHRDVLEKTSWKTLVCLPVNNYSVREMVLFCCGFVQTNVMTYMTDMTGNDMTGMEIVRQLVDAAAQPTTQVAESV